MEETQSLLALTNTSYGNDLAVAGAVADHYARQNRFETYQAPRPTNTLRRQAIDLRLFASYLADAQVVREGAVLFCNPDAWRGITSGLVEGFVAWQLEKGYAISSINGRLATVKTYCRLAHQAGVLPAEIMIAIKHVEGYSHKDGRNLDRQREVSRMGCKKVEWVKITRVQAARLKRQPTTTAEGRRDGLLMCLLLDHGLRCGEIAGLSADSIDLAAGTITFYREKVDKVQIHELSEDTLVAASTYLPAVSTTGPLFPGYKGKPISTRAINLRVGLLGQQIGIDHLSPHDCRHYWTSSASKGGSDIKSMQQAGGWSSPAMVLHYIENSTVANKGIKLG